MNINIILPIYLHMFFYNFLNFNGQLGCIFCPLIGFITFIKHIHGSSIIGLGPCIILYGFWIFYTRVPILIILFQFLHSFKIFLFTNSSFLIGLHGFLYSFGKLFVIGMIFLPFPLY